MTLAVGKHPFPFRTRQLSPSAPMVLHTRVVGESGRCRKVFLSKSPRAIEGASCPAAFFHVGFRDAQDSLTLTELATAVALRPARTRAAAPWPRRPPLIVIGVDGGEWKVIRRLWAEGKLPHFKAIADRGITATLHTAYNSSPVIWTTIATGVIPEVHGITDFVVPTPRGDVPVSSAVRKVPALWNMLSRAGRRVAVLGWWASWPAEPVNGAWC